MYRKTFFYWDSYTFIDAFNIVAIQPKKEIKLKNADISTQKMYNLNVNSTEFNQRTKSVFDTLDILEVSHKTKLTEYVESAVVDDETEGESELINETAAVFKVPAIPKRSISESNDFKTQPKRAKQSPDFLANPHKWKKYSLEDVSDSQTSQRANYAAAMSILNSKNMIIDQDDQEHTQLDTRIVFNRPIGKGRKTLKTNVRNLATLDESLEPDELKDDISATLESKPSKDEVKDDSFKKRNRKQNRRNCLQEDDEVEEAANKQEQTLDTDS